VKLPKVKGKYTFRIDDEKSNGILDFSNVKHDLTFEVNGENSVIVIASVEHNNQTFKFEVIATGIANIIGGLGNNTYKIKEGGKLTGKLTGGSPAGQDAGKINLLDYSEFGKKVVVNLTDKPITFDSNVKIENVGPQTGVLPKQEKWEYEIDKTEGSMRLELAGEKSEFFLFLQRIIMSNRIRKDSKELLKDCLVAPTLL